MKEPRGGAYTSSRAAALSGVPLSTLSYWARHGVLDPSLAKGRPRLWTYSDVVAMRIISWLRHDKPTAVKTSMPEVKRALAGLELLGARLGSPRTGIRVDRTGRLFFALDGNTWQPVRARGPQVAAVIASDWLEPLVEYVATSYGTRGPDLRRPRPHLVIIPGKLSGEPHVAHTRIGTQGVAALVRDDGLDPAQVVALYPDLTEESVRECVDLEVQLGKNLVAA